MSVSFMWEVVKPGRARSFGAGTSSDIKPLKETFGEEISSADIHTLRAMHQATHNEVSLWSEIADALERLGGDDGLEVKIRVWTEF